MKKLIIVSLLPLFLWSCSEKKESKEEEITSEVEEYSLEGILHNYRNKEVYLLKLSQLSERRFTS